MEEGLLVVGARARVLVRRASDQNGVTEYWSAGVLDY
jgi:hypothetical protein